MKLFRRKVCRRSSRPSRKRSRVLEIRFARLSFSQGLMIGGDNNDPSPTAEATRLTEPSGRLPPQRCPVGLSLTRTERDQLSDRGRTRKYHGADKAVLVQSYAAVEPTRIWHGVEHQEDVRDSV